MINCYNKNKNGLGICEIDLKKDKKGCTPADGVVSVSSDYRCIEGKCQDIKKR